MNEKLDPSLRALIPIIICIVVITLPFVICDLYYAYNDKSECLDQKIQNYSISFTLRTWLKVHGYTTLVLLILLFLTIFAAFISPALALTLGFCTICFALLHGIFKFAWLIVGCLMFQGQLYPAHTCSKSLNDYMWAMLIISLIGTFTNVGLRSHLKSN